MLNFGTLYITFLLLLMSCNPPKTNKQELFQQRIQEIQVNGLDLYPQIYPCDSLPVKKCFQQQLISELQKSLIDLNRDYSLKKKDTIWILTTVNKDGQLHLNTLKNSNNQILSDRISITLRNLSPIKPASINGISVSSSYKIPLIFKSQ